MSVIIIAPSPIANTMGTIIRAIGSCSLGTVPGKEQTPQNRHAARTNTAGIEPRMIATREIRVITGDWSTWAFAAGRGLLT